MDMVITGKSIYGVPLGGIGAGTIGRGFRGEFTRFQMIPGRNITLTQPIQVESIYAAFFYTGVYKYNTVWADAFHICVKESGSDRVVYQSVLGSQRTKEKKLKKKLSRWEYNVKDKDIEYLVNWFFSLGTESSLKLDFSLSRRLSILKLGQPTTFPRLTLP